MNSEPITIPLNGGLRLVVPAGCLRASVLRDLFNGDNPRPETPVSAARKIAVPAIGAEWNGGIYAGLTIADDAPAALILLPGDEDDLTWAKATSWAAKQGGVLPSRFDHLVLYKNLKSQFKQECYWSSEQHADGSASAWRQSFDTGSQNYWHPSSLIRARAVRRVPI